MSKQVRIAVFPAGGLGTRFLPATKVIPKEMLALVDKPVIQYGVEEAVASGIEHIIIVTGRGKGAMEDHFDHSFELDAALERKGKHELLAVSRGVSSLARIIWIGRFWRRFVCWTTFRTARAGCFRRSCAARPNSSKGSSRPSCASSGRALRCDAASNPRPIRQHAHEEMPS